MLRIKAFRSNHVGQSVLLYRRDRTGCLVSSLRSASEPDQRKLPIPMGYVLCWSHICIFLLHWPASPTTRGCSVLLLEEAEAAWGKVYLGADGSFHSFFVE